MKRYQIKIIFSFLAFLLLITVSCDINEELFDSVGVDNFYQTEEELNLALNDVYKTLWTDMWRDGQWLTLSDVTGGTMLGGGDPNGSGDRSGNNTPWNSFTWTSDEREIPSFWDQTYHGINEANTLIDKIPDSNAPSNAKVWIEGQAKFLRGLFYFNLVRIFGGVPLEIQGTYDLSDIEKPRSSVDEVYSQIIADLQDAEQMLSPYNEGDHTAGRATSAAAKAKEVIDMGVFELFEDYDDILNPNNSNGKEMIFSIQHGGTSNENASRFWTRMIYLLGPPAHTLEDGTNIIFHRLQDVVIFQVPRDIYDSVPNSHRKWETMRDRMPYYFAGGSLVEDTVNLYAPFTVKYHYPNLYTGNLREGVDFPIIRCSDMLLTYAEAENEVNGGPTPAAYDAINEVRQRARAIGTPNEQPESVSTDLAGLSQSEFRDAVLTERAREIVGEGHSRWDLLRHDRLISNAQERGVNNAADHHVLFPIPGGALSVNPELEQNPGY